MSKEYDNLVDEFGELCNLSYALNDAIGYGFEQGTDQEYLHTLSLLVAKKIKNLHKEFYDFSCKDFMLNN